MSKFYKSIVIYLSVVATGIVYLYPNDNSLLINGIIFLTIGYLLFLFAMSMSINSNFYLKAINRNKSEKVVLTFDDGPHPKHTLRILDILDNYNVKAVFFMIGKNIKAHPKIAKEVANRGHQIGIHSQSHNYNFGISSGKKLRIEIKQCAETIKNTIGLSTILFRPPFGVTNPLIAAEVKKQKLSTIGWNVRSFDTTTDNSDKILDRIIKKIGKSSIVLLHDRLDQTCEALPHIIEKIHSLGLTIGQLSVQKSEHK